MWTRVCVHMFSERSTTSYVWVFLKGVCLFFLSLYICKNGRGLLEVRVILPPAARQENLKTTFITWKHLLFLQPVSLRMFCALLLNVEKVNFGCVSYVIVTLLWLE